jgi:hypothetical protein
MTDCGDRSLLLFGQHPLTNFEPVRIRGGQHMVNKWVRVPARVSIGGKSRKATLLDWRLWLPSAYWALPLPERPPNQLR